MEEENLQNNVTQSPLQSQSAVPSLTVDPPAVKKKPMWKVIIPIVIGVLVLGAAGAYFVFKDKISDYLSIGQSSIFISPTHKAPDQFSYSDNGTFKFQTVLPAGFTDYGKKKNGSNAGSLILTKTDGENKILITVGGLGPSNTTTVETYEKYLTANNYPYKEKKITIGKNISATQLYIDSKVQGKYYSTLFNANNMLFTADLVTKGNVDLSTAKSAYAQVLGGISF